jgi:hypothetical protein
MSSPVWQCGVVSDGVMCGSYIIGVGWFHHQPISSSGTLRYNTVRYITVQYGEVKKRCDMVCHCSEMLCMVR